MITNVILLLLLILLPMFGSNQNLHCWAGVPHLAMELPSDDDGIMELPSDDDGEHKRPRGRPRGHKRPVLQQRGRLLSAAADDLDLPEEVELPDEVANDELDDLFGDVATLHKEHRRVAKVLQGKKGSTIMCIQAPPLQMSWQAWCRTRCLM